MNLNTIREYRRELEAWYRELQEKHPESLEGLGATDDSDAFHWEMTMLGVTTSKRQHRKEDSE